LRSPVSKLAGDAAFGFGAEEFVVFEKNHAEKIDALMKLAVNNFLGVEL